MSLILMICTMQMSVKYCDTFIIHNLIFLDFSLTQWRSDMFLPAVGDIPSNYLLRLMDETGIAAYLKEPGCSTSAGVYTGSANGTVNGWTSGKCGRERQVKKNGRNK